MTNRRTTKQALVASIVILCMTFTMLLGTTFAWFTDSATSAGNKIVAGTLDVELQMWNGSAYENIGDSKQAIFGKGSLAQNNNAETLWEPGKTQVVYLKIVNAGSLDLKYSVAINVRDNADDKDLYKVLEYAIDADAKPTDAELPAWDGGKKVNVGNNVDTNNVTLPAKEDGSNLHEHYFALSVHMLEEAGNEYQNGYVEFDIKVLATQVNTEEDSFGPNYDKDALYPGVSNPADVATEEIVLETEGDNPTTVTIPASLATNLSAEKITLDAQYIGATETKDADGNVTAITVHYSYVDLFDENGDVIELEGNTEPMTVKLYVGTEYAGKYATIKHDNTTIATLTVAADGYVTYNATHFCAVSANITDELPEAGMGDVKDETAEDLTKLVEVLVGNHYYTVSQGMANSWYEYPSVPGKIEASIYVPEDLIAFAMMYNNGDLAETGSHSDLTLVNNLDYTGYNWIPIGRFYTNIHGEGKTISNLNDSFLGCVYDCQIDNLTLENVTASGSAAGVVGKELAGDMYISNLTIAGKNTVTYVEDNATNWPEEGTGVGAICGVSLIGCGGHGDVDITVTGTIEVNYNGVFFGNNTNLENLGVSTEFGLNVYKANANANVTVADGDAITTNGQGYLFDKADLEDGFALDKITGKYYVLNAMGLATFAADVNAGNTYSKKTVVLFDNIDLENKEWTPIGNSTNIFKGTFDGNNKVISNLYVNMPGKSNAGLFGFTTDGEIKNLTVENAIVIGRLNVGVVAGTPYTSKYTNITVTGHVEVEGMSYVGGVGGKNAYANWTNITVAVDDTSFVNANSVENGIAYRTYVGGVSGFNGEGGHTFKNITTNIDVIGSTCDVGGAFGIAHYNNKFENITVTGDVTITAAAEVDDAEEMGGIAGTWHNENGTTVSFTNCRFNGKLDAKNIDGVNLKDNTIVGKAYSATGTGKLVIDGVSIGAVFYEVANAEDLQSALANNENVVLSGNITVPAADAGSNAYGATGINVTASQTFDGNGNSFGVNSWNTWDSAISTTGGLIKNVTINNGMRGIFINHNSDYSSKVILENVIINGTIYTISCDQGTNKGLQAINSTFNGWTSYAATIGDVEFVNCSFGEGAGYNFSRPYAPTTYIGCNFEAGHEIDARAAVTFENCYLNDVLLTAENIGDLVISNLDNVTVR